MNYSNSFPFIHESGKVKIYINNIVKLKKDNMETIVKTFKSCFPI